jgi:hypothetical protein
VVENAALVRLCATSSFGRRGRDLRRNPVPDVFELCVCIGNYFTNACADDIQRIALSSQPFELDAVTIFLRVAFVMTAKAACQRLYQRWALPASSTSNGCGRRVLHRNRILTIDDDSGHAITSRALGNAGH